MEMVRISYSESCNLDSWVAAVQCNHATRINSKLCNSIAGQLDIVSERKYVDYFHIVVWYAGEACMQCDIVSGIVYSLSSKLFTKAGRT